MEIVANSKKNVDNSIVKRLLIYFKATYYANYSKNFIIRFWIAHLESVIFELR